MTISRPSAATILDQQGARHIGVNPQQPPETFALAPNEDVALRRAEEKASNEQRPAGPVLRLWKGSAGGAPRGPPTRRR
jgi:hypothetical protein